MEKITVKEAREKGLQFYFTGKPCKSGHITKRYVSTYHCHICENSKEREKQNKWQREYKKRHPHRIMFKHAKERAKRKGITFTLDNANQLKDIWPKDNRCPILGIEFIEAGIELRGPARNSPSLDRIDNTKGYEIDNIQIISHTANTYKSNKSIEQLAEEIAGWNIWLEKQR